MSKIILATTSPYKIALFRKFDLPFEAKTPNYSEPDLAMGPQDLAATHARGKAASIAGKTVIGMDQVLAMGNEVFKKPGSMEKAVEQVMKLRGKEHQLYTAFSIRHLDKWYEGITTSTLMVHAKLQKGFIEKMVEKDQTQTCVGGYKIESLGLQLMSRVETSDWDAIIGQPTLEMAQTLAKLGFFPGKFDKDSQNY